jgi:hypothetical protein
MTDFNKLYFGEFKLSDRELAIRSAAERYVRDCETYDRTVCTGPVTRDGIMPCGPVEQGLSVRNSRRVLADICAEANGYFTSKDVIREAARINPGDLR